MTETSLLQKLTRMRGIQLCVMLPQELDCYLLDYNGYIVLSENHEEVSLQHMLLFKYKCHNFFP